MSTIIDKWIDGVFPSDDGKHMLVFLEENPNLREDLWGEIQSMVRRHYVADNVTASRLEQLGAQKTAALLRMKQPTTKTARSGEMGEILATEIAEKRLNWRVPIRRLQWKDGRNMALRGDDLTAIWLSDTGELWFLKGESKSRAGSVSSAVTEASEGLDRDRGRPSGLSILFLTERLREQGEKELATRIEDALTESFKGCVVNHLLFAVTGNDPKKALTEHFGKLGGHSRQVKS